MKNVLTTGSIIVFAIGIVYFVGKTIFDVSVSIFGPLILMLFNKEYLVVPLTIFFTAIIVIVVGILFSHIGFRTSVSNRLKKVLPHGECGALVSLSPGVYFLAIIIGKTSFKDLQGVSRSQYVLYAPSSPVPISGLPIIFVETDKVIPLKMTLQQVYATIASFGRNAPKLLEESKNQSAD